MRLAFRFLGLSIIAFAFAAVANSTVSPKRLAKLAKGVNVTSWFRQDRLKPNEFFLERMPDFEMERIRALGFTHVRLSIYPTLIMNPDGSVNDRIYPFFRKAIERLIQAKLAVVVDIHNQDQDFLQGQPQQQVKFLQFWGNLADRLKSLDPEMVFFELLNEPVFANREDEWIALQQALVLQVRSAAPAHTIICTGPNSGGIRGLLRLAPVQDGNVIYSFHVFDPLPFTHQGAIFAPEEIRVTTKVPYPSSPSSVAPLIRNLKGQSPRAVKSLTAYGNDRWDLSKMQAKFEQALRWGKKNQVPVWVGEFGALGTSALPADRKRWFRDIAQVLGRTGIPWCLWGWDDGFGLSRKVSGTTITFDLMVAESLKLKLK